MVLAGLVDAGDDLLQKGRQALLLVVRGELPLAAAVDAEDAHGPSLVDKGEVVGGLHGETLRQFEGERVIQGRHVTDPGRFLGGVDPADQEFLRVDGEALPPDAAGVDAVGGGAFEAAAGQVFQVDAATMVWRDETNGLHHDVQDVFEVFLAVTADLGRQLADLGREVGCRIHGYRVPSYVGNVLRHYTRWPGPLSKGGFPSVLVR